MEQLNGRRLERPTFRERFLGFVGMRSPLDTEAARRTISPYDPQYLRTGTVLVEGESLPSGIGPAPIGEVPRIDPCSVPEKFKVGIVVAETPSDLTQAAS